MRVKSNEDSTLHVTEGLDRHNIIEDLGRQNICANVQNTIQVLQNPKPG